MYLLVHVSPSCVLRTIRKLLARRGALALFRGILTQGEKVMDFEVFNIKKKLKNYILLCFGCGNSIRYTSFFMKC